MSISFYHLNIHILRYSLSSALQFHLFLRFSCVLLIFQGFSVVSQFQKQPSEVFCKKVFLEVSQNSQENTCARVSFLPAALLKKRLWHRCFPVIFVKFLKTPFYTEHLWTTASNFPKTVSQ